ncbi:MAG: efflux RND transporter periplasmic adaptor subunit [Burkholderiaceae bacterium]|nr:efflux RND transporter periplasmic adaptor subunit [Burkholderiaceae bacterium]
MGDSKAGEQIKNVDADLLSQLRIQDDARDLGARHPNWLIPLTAVVLLLLLGGGASWWYLHRPLAVQVSVAQAAGEGGGDAVVQATGYLTAQREATVSTQITGTLTEVLFDAGDHVRKGQVLARLDDGALRAGLDAARANERSAQAQVEQARAELLQSQADAKRAAELAAQGMVSRQSTEQADSAVAVNAATLLSRQRAADAAHAQQIQAQVNFDYATVRAPFAGVIITKAAQVGEIVSPLSAGGGFTRTGVGTLVDMDSIEVEVDVNEASIGQIKPGMRCEAVLDAYPDWKVPSHVITIIPTADRGKATVKVRVALEQRDERMVPDMGVRVSFLRPADKSRKLAAQSGVTVAPEAVVTRNGDRIVFVLVQDHVVLRKVRMDGSRVVEGLQAGEQVVMSPPDTLADGITVVPAPSH